MSDDKKKSKSKSSTELELFNSIPTQPFISPFAHINDNILFNPLDKKIEANNPSTEHKNSSSVTSSPASSVGSSVDHLVAQKAKNSLNGSSFSNSPASSVDSSVVHSQAQSVAHINDLSSELVSELPSEPPTDLLTELPNKILEKILSKNKINHKDPVFWLNDNYAKILSYLSIKEDRIGNIPTIEKIIKVSSATVKRGVIQLEKLGFLTKGKNPFNKGKIRGFTYELNTKMILNFMEKRGNNIISELASELLTEPPSELASERATELPFSNSSSSIYINTTTTKGDEKKIEEVINKSPEMGYWRQKGLKAKQIKKWMEIIQSDFETMLQYLQYCSFDMVDNELEVKKEIESVFNWFFKILENTGAYPRPKNYKSYKEKQIEEKKLILAEKERLANEEKEIYKKIIEAEQDKRFWQMMKETEGELYKTCFEKINNIAKRNKKGVIFENAMRNAFDEIDIASGTE